MAEVEITVSLDEVTLAQARTRAGDDLSSYIDDAVRSRLHRDRLRVTDAQATSDQAQAVGEDVDTIRVQSIRPRDTENDTP